MLTEALLAACCHQPGPYGDWQAWSNTLQTPLSPLPEGQELVCDPRFAQLKRAIAAMTEANFGQVFLQTSELLDRETKDLRLAGYLLPAASHEFGAEGLVMALSLFNRLLSHPGLCCFPQKNKGRQRLHHWVLGQQSRILVFVGAKTSSVVVLTELAGLLAEYSELARRHLDPEAGPLSQLCDWAASQLAKETSRARKSANPTPAGMAAGTAPRECESPVTTTNASEPPPPKNVLADPSANAIALAIASEAEFRRGVSALLDHDREQQQFRRMMLLARATRWGTMQLPGGKVAKSNIPAPRARALAPLRQALSAGQWLPAFLLAEKLFMEGTLHFYLDLQHLCHQALNRAEQPSLCRLHKQQMLFWLSQYPGWQELSYDDGTMMAGRETRAWLTSLQSGQQSDQAVPAASHVEPVADTRMESVLAWAEKGQLDKAMADIETLPLSEPRDMLRRQLLQARAFLAANRPLWARPILQSLLDCIERHQLGRWWPSLAALTWRTGLECYSRLLPGGTADEQREWTQQINRMREQLLLSCPARAVEWLSVVDK